MKHYASQKFWDAYECLPESVKRLADKNFELLKRDPQHPSLRLKKIRRYYSVRAGRGYRALGVDANGEIVWFWIGSHGDYDTLLKRG